MTEKLLQYIWQFQYYNKSNLTTTTGDPVDVLFQGELNRGQGPDFLNAKIRIGGTLLAGSVELHLKTTDWYRHQHQNDPNYNNVILHVVLEHDQLFKNPIPVLALQPRIATLMLQQYQALMDNPTFIPCAATIAQTRPLTLQSWKERLVAERLTRKTDAIFQLLQQNNNHWEEVFWQVLARTFGSTVNGEAFEGLARSVPIKLLARHKNSIHQLEALLLGQANLLNGEFSDAYAQLLQREYRFLKTKYNLHPIVQPLHFLRMRPSNFPTVRLAQLAMLIHGSAHLFSKLITTTDITTVRKLFAVTANDFWHYHYNLDEPSAYKPKKVGAAMIDTVLINTAIPILFAYGLYHKSEAEKTKAILWLESLPPEANSITNGFTQLAVASNSAFDSQALLELKKEYCSHKRCLQCAIGNALLKRSS